MKNIIKTGGYKYILITIISILISGATLLANDKKLNDKNTIEENSARIEREIVTMNAQVVELQKEIKSMKELVNTLEDSRKETYIITREAPVFAEKSSYSKKMGTFPINSVVTVTSISEDGIWLECERGYFKIYNAIALINAQDRTTFIVEEDKVARTQQPTEEKKTLVDGSKSIVGKSNLTLEQVETLLAGSPMSGHGKAVLEIEDTYNINAFFTIAVAQGETQRGKTGTGASKKNPYGLTQRSGGYRTFDSYTDAIITFGDTLNRLYVPNGRTTVETVNAIYCPGSNEWSKKVRTIMTRYLNNLT